mmetsp:Transcript_47262/g.150846  ORF Transcript_47262/g.150846 Transcript_47262/m.150846 type:complete len:263 (-) Transcript_47262:1363-2151(-)
MKLRISARVTTPCAVPYSSSPWITTPAVLPRAARSRRASSALMFSGSSTRGSLQRLPRLRWPPRKRSCGRRQPRISAAVTNGQRKLELDERSSFRPASAPELGDTTSTARWPSCSALRARTSEASSSRYATVQWRRFAKGTRSKGEAWRLRAPLMSRSSELASTVGLSAWPGSPCPSSCVRSSAPWLPRRQARALVPALLPLAWLLSSGRPGSSACRGSCSSGFWPCSCSSARSSARLYFMEPSCSSCSMRLSRIVMMGLDM